MWLAFTTNPHLLETAVAIDGWMEKREGSADVGLATNAVRVRATGIQQQLLWITTVEGSWVRHQQARVHIGVLPDTQIHSTRATVWPSTSTPGRGHCLGVSDNGLGGRLGSRTLILRFVLGD